MCHAFSNDLSDMVACTIIHSSGRSSEREGDQGRERVIKGVRGRSREREGDQGRESENNTFKWEIK